VSYYYLKPPKGEFETSKRFFISVKVALPESSAIVDRLNAIPLGPKTYAAGNSIVPAYIHFV